MAETASTRLPTDAVDRIESYAEERNITRSEALRELATAGLDLTGDDNPQLGTSDQLRQMADTIEQLERSAADVHRTINAQHERLNQLLTDHIDLSNIEREHLEAFADEPYKVLPKAESEYYVVVPRFIPFSAGHLQQQNDAWNVFVINKYVNWLDELPETIESKVDFGQRYDHAEVDGSILQLASEGERDRAWDDLGGMDGGLNKRVGDTKIQIKRGKEFDVIAKLIEEGNLPFAPSPIVEDDLRGEPEQVSLRPYQERAWDTFLETGQVGVYWPPSLGKTFFALYAGERISGKKLVVVPSSTLENQWKERIQAYTSHRQEWDVKTYQYLTTNNNIEEYQGDSGPALTIFDECHTLPANTFSRLATLDTTYRIGLSATPYREDERTDYIFALTGHPVGIEWRELIEYGDLEFPEVDVYLYRTQRQKREDLSVLASEPGKTLIFCDGIDAGKRLSEELDIPFVYGETPKSDRMDILRDNRVVIGSRVADEGVSLENLDRVIEYQFHGGSRRQELQRAGRVMHGTGGTGQHIVQMTDDEYENFGNRLYSLEEKGMDIRVERRV